jgi:hypothetical protein
MTLTGPGTSVAGVDQGGVAVFSFDNVSIPASVEIEVEGWRPCASAAGLNGPTGTGGAGGSAYGDLNVLLQGGSGGSSGASTGGGGGGGAIALFGTSVWIAPSGEVLADGGDGTPGSGGASAGGSGGGILLRANGPPRRGKR